VPDIQINWDFVHPLGNIASGPAKMFLISYKDDWMKPGLRMAFILLSWTRKNGF